MSEFFSELYEPIANDGDIESLESNIYIPLTDDPITMDEITISSNQMKKGGFDYPREVLQVLLSGISSIILLLLNMILYNSWPSILCVSLLSLIPKTGNLRLPTNFRGIQMQPLFANLFDRILGNRLLSWVKINDEQTAFQKGKGTLDQIFLLRIIIALIKHKNMTLYIGYFDLSKAFDRVSRYLLLKTLVRMGIGSVMLNAFKRMYASTRCVLKGFGKVSEIFEMHTGIKQGASSSVILFITFMGDIIDNLKERCEEEPLINDLHCLLHCFLRGFLFRGCFSSGISFSEISFLGMFFFGDFFFEDLFLRGFLFRGFLFRGSFFSGISFSEIFFTEVFVRCFLFRRSFCRRSFLFRGSFGRGFLFRGSFGEVFHF